MSACCLICLQQATVYCSNDEAFLCSACDASCHSSALAMRHVRQRVCAVCCRKASTVYCRNDDAFLCAECDASAHANPLAARHLRVPASEAEAYKPAAENAQPADCVSESADVPVTTTQPPQPAAPAPVAPMGIVPPAVELPTNQVMDKDALAKSFFGKELEVSDLLACRTGHLCLT